MAGRKRRRVGVATPVAPLPVPPADPAAVYRRSASRDPAWERRLRQIRAAVEKASETCCVNCADLCWMPHTGGLPGEKVPLPTPSGQPLPFSLVSSFRTVARWTMSMSVDCMLALGHNLNYIISVHLIVAVGHAVECNFRVVTVAHARVRVDVLQANLRTAL